MTSNLPAPSDESRAVVRRDAPLPPESATPAKTGGQNVAAGLVPFAIVTFLVIAFVLAAWTLLAVAGAGG